MTTARTLADSLRAVYSYYLTSLTDPHTERIFARDWPSNNRTLGLAIRRAGSVVWFEPQSPTDGSPFVVASVVESSGDVRFQPATADEVRGLASAEDFNVEGEPLS